MSTSNHTFCNFRADLLRIKIDDLEDELNVTSWMESNTYRDLDAYNDNLKTEHGFRIINAFIAKRFRSQ